MNPTERLLMISDPSHPHYPETGRFTGKVITPLWGGTMAEVRLDNCKHGTEGCFVSKGQVRFIAEPKPEAKGKKRKPEKPRRIKGINEGDVVAMRRLRKIGDSSVYFDFKNPDNHVAPPGKYTKLKVTSGRPKGKTR